MTNEEKTRVFLQSGIRGQEDFINEIKYFGDKEPYKSRIIMCAYARELLKGALNVLNGLDPREDNE